MAREYLQKKDYRIVMTNFRTLIGRNRRGAAVTGEIDIVALEGDILCFVEVKTRTSDDFASPLSAVDLRKQRQITRTARVYRKTFGLMGWIYRFDGIGVVLKKRDAPRINLIKDFWHESKFRKKIWLDAI